MVEAYDAELRQWAFHYRLGLTVCVGRVFNDRKGRWPDGYAIATSEVTSGALEEGSVITTLHSRYLLSGPAEDSSAWRLLFERQEANALRRRAVEQDERLFDLLQAAWGMKDATFEAIAGLPARWMWQWRNHYRAPTDTELARVRRLMSFHEAIRLVIYGEPDYAKWWRHKRHEGGPYGSKSSLEAILESGDTAMDDLERRFRSQAGW
jgi:hypothetical protein